MDVRVKFLGGAQSVTGSKYLLEIDDYRLLIDCGLFQGLKPLRMRNWTPFPIDASSIDAIILTHAHIDHSGYLPRIVNEGFAGPVYCTSATAALLEIMLLDAAKLQEEEAGYARKKGYSKHENPLPLFNTKDAQVALNLLKGYEYNEPLTISDGIQVVFHEAGHILGSSIITLLLSGKQQRKTIVFSGDLGRYDQPLHDPPTSLNQADVLFVESTYGNRINTSGNIEEIFAELINEAFQKGGCLLIPSFAVGRTQLLLYYLFTLMQKQLIPRTPVYLDSPMAINTTSLYKKYRRYHKLHSESLGKISLFDFEQFKYYRNQEQSMNLNEIKNSSIIISASGMCTGGRILHHLYHRLQRKQDTVLFAGYQPKGTRGRKILDGDPTSRIFGIDVPVKSNVKQLNGLSAHADQNELLQWLGSFESSPKITFIVHGEIESAEALKKKIEDKYEWNNVIIPDYLESYKLFSHI
jgi:metallo-beta-lactamase family protein